MNKPQTPPFAIAQGFTLLEILFVLVIIGLLAALAVPIYSGYLARSHSAELVLKFDAVKTRMGTLIGTGNVQTNCGSLAAQVNPVNLQSKYAGMAVGFEPVPGGFTPVLQYCATLDACGGSQGIEVVRETHNVLARSAAISKPAILGDSAASFSVRLAGDTVVCTALPIAKQPQICTKPPGTAMHFTGSGAIRPHGQDLRTRTSGLKGITVELMVLAEPPPSGSVLFNYGDNTQHHNSFTLSNPGSLNVAVHNVNFNTGLNLRDGQNHRVSVAWDSGSGVLSVYDNGRLFKSFSNAVRGGTLPGNGQVAIGTKDDGHGQYNNSNAFSGEIVRTSVVDRFMSAAELTNPIHQTLAGRGDLLMDVTVQDGKVVDTTGRHNMEMVGGASVPRSTVATCSVPMS